MTELKSGDKAPNFSLPDQDGKTHQLEDYKGEKLVLFFYPKDNTPACTVQACNLRDNHAVLQKAGFKILGISMDSEKKHTNFIEKHSLPFPLLADTEKEMVNAYQEAYQNAYNDAYENYEDEESRTAYINAYADAFEKQTQDTYNTAFNEAYERYTNEYANAEANQNPGIITRLWNSFFTN